MRTIVVLESHAELRRFITVLLMRAGHRGLPAQSVAQATALLAATRVDLVVIDLARCLRTSGAPLACWRREHPAVEIVALANSCESTGYLRLAAVLGAPWAAARSYMSEALMALTRRGGEQNSVCVATQSLPIRGGIFFPRHGEG